MSNDLPLTTSGTIASNIQIILPNPWRVGIEWKETERGKRTKKHRVGSAKRGPRSVSEAERSDGLPVGAELRHEAGSVMCASAVGETKARTEMAAGWRKKKRAKERCRRGQQDRGFAVADLG